MLLRSRYFKTLITRLHHRWVKPFGHDTGVHVYNCTARETVPLIVGNKNVVSWYTCGPTVYDSAHIGHASCYVKVDIIQRILHGRFNLNIVTVMNITDIDDKIIRRSSEQKVAPEEISRRYEKEFWEDMDSLGIRRPDLVIRVTEMMPEILRFIDGLVEKKMAYEARDGSVYFDVAAYGDGYGKLQNIGQGDEIEGGEFKKSAADFALWKGAKEGEPRWESKYGFGRPGWHIECSAIAGAVLGSTIDIHAGGIDLRFPHHENEEAQCCAYFGTPQWSNYWLHAGHLHLKNSTKMSKSLKNTVSIRDMLKTCDANVFRIACLMSSYRNSMEFSQDLVNLAETQLKTYRNFLHECRLHVGGILRSNLNSGELLRKLAATVEANDTALGDNFDTATCLKNVNSLVSTCNKMLHSAADSGSSSTGVTALVAISSYVSTLFSHFGLNLDVASDVAVDASELADAMNLLVTFRQKVRQMGISNKSNELLGLCDDIRESARQCGFTLNDRGKVSTWSK